MQGLPFELSPETSSDVCGKLRPVLDSQNLSAESNRFVGNCWTEVDETCPHSWLLRSKAKLYLQVS